MSMCQYSVCVTIGEPLLTDHWCSTRCHCHESGTKIKQLKQVITPIEQASLRLRQLDTDHSTARIGELTSVCDEPALKLGHDLRCGVALFYDFSSGPLHQIKLTAHQRGDVRFKDVSRNKASHCDEVFVAKVRAARANCRLHHRDGKAHITACGDVQRFQGLV